MRKSQKTAASRTLDLFPTAATQPTPRADRPEYFVEPRCIVERFVLREPESILVAVHYFAGRDGRPPLCGRVGLTEVSASGAVGICQQCHAAASRLRAVVQ